MFGRMIVIIIFILVLWAIVMHFLLEKRQTQPYRVKPDTVALTFNEGPSPSYTREILSILKKNNINATFFVLGKNAEHYPEIVNEAYSDGNAIACLGMNYPGQTEATLEQIKEELTNCKNIISNIIGKYPICYQPAYNKINPLVQNYIESQNLVIIKPEIDTTDLKSSDVNKIVFNTLSLIGPQKILTMHDGSDVSKNRSATVNSLPILIEKIEKMGLGFSRICYP